MDHRDIEREIANMLPPGPDAQPSPGLLAKLERTVAADLRPVKPLRPAWQLAAIWCAIFLALVIAGVVKLDPLALPEMGAPVSILVLGVLAICVGGTMLSLAQQMTPGSRYRFPPGLLPFAALIMLAVMFFLLFPIEESPLFWQQGWICFSVGIEFAVAAAALLWFFLRRGAYLDARLAGATVGLLAGLAGTAVLSIHCPILETSHVVAWHLGALATATLAGAAIGAIASRRYTPQQ
jgi:hypothetical protein